VPERAQSVVNFVDQHHVVDQNRTVTINAYSYSGEGAVSEARRLAYYRAMMARKQLIEAKVPAGNIRININDTADKEKGSTVETVVLGNGVP
jgi:hypothetical protein